VEEGERGRGKGVEGGGGGSKDGGVQRPGKTDWSNLVCMDECGGEEEI